MHFCFGFIYKFGIHDEIVYIRFHFVVYSYLGELEESDENVYCVTMIHPVIIRA
jgi:hypothetical protein